MARLGRARCRRGQGHTHDAVTLAQSAGVTPGCAGSKVGVADAPSNWEKWPASWMIWIERSIIIERRNVAIDEWVQIAVRCRDDARNGPYRTRSISKPFALNNSSRSPENVRTDI